MALAGINIVFNNVLVKALSNWISLYKSMWLDMGSNPRSLFESKGLITNETLYQSSTVTNLSLFKRGTKLMHGSRGWGGGGQEVQTLPPEKSQKYRFLSNTVPHHLKITKLPSQIQYWAIIDMPAKRHLNSVLLAGRWWPTYSGIWILPVPSSTKKKTPLKLDPLWKNFMDLRM